MKGMQTLMCIFAPVYIYVQPILAEVSFQVYIDKHMGQSSEYVVIHSAYSLSPTIPPHPQLWMLPAQAVLYSLTLCR